MKLDDDDAPEFTEEVKAKAFPASEDLSPKVLDAFGKIKAGLEDAKAFQDGTADPATYRIHHPKRG